MCELPGERANPAVSVAQTLRPSGSVKPIVVNGWEITYDPSGPLGKLYIANRKGHQMFAPSLYEITVLAERIKEPS